MKLTRREAIDYGLTMIEKCTDPREAVPLIVAKVSDYYESIIEKQRVYFGCETNKYVEIGQKYASLDEIVKVAVIEKIKCGKDHTVIGYWSVGDFKFMSADDFVKNFIPFIQECKWTYRDIDGEYKITEEYLTPEEVEAKNLKQVSYVPSSQRGRHPFREKHEPKDKQ